MEPETIPPPYSDTPSSAKRAGKGLFGSLKFIVLVLALTLGINFFGLQSYQVDGQSMYPTLSHGDRLIISKFGRTKSKLLQNDFIPARGDIVVFHDPFAQGRFLIKRVIGLPGERISLQNGDLQVYDAAHTNGFRPDADLQPDLLFTVGTVDLTVPEGELFVVGDNRGQGGSLDSRNHLGTVPTDSVVGVLFLRLFPLSDIDVF